MAINVLLTPKVSFVPLENNLGPGRFLMFPFVVILFEIFWGCVVLQELHEYIIFVSIGCQMKKLWLNKQEMDIDGQPKKNHKKSK